MLMWKIIMYMSKDTVASSAGTPAASIPPPRSSQQCWHTAPLYQFTSVMGWTKPGREGKWKQNTSEDVRKSLPETKAWKSPSAQLKCPGMKEDAEDEGDGRRGPWGEWAGRGERGGWGWQQWRPWMMKVVSCPTEVPNWSAKRMMPGCGWWWWCCKGFYMIQTTQMTGMIKVIRMNQWWG